MSVKYCYHRTLSVSFLRGFLFINGTYASQRTSNHRQQHTSKLSVIYLNKLKEMHYKKICTHYIKTFDECAEQRFGTANGDNKRCAITEIGFLDD